ncbi:hypothetical protein BJ742DRAFT_736295 [Cladochytrium replicatum]|nr:hypothetical protein BJ742DRAFT_736295 [Cladochytrium replicatum]
MCGAQNAGVLNTLEMDAINRAQHFGGADEMSERAGCIDIEDRGRHVTWAGIARGKRRDRDGRVESGSLQQQRHQCDMLVNWRSSGWAQITDQEATPQGLHIELATLRGHANEEFAAIRSEIEVVRNGIADAVATVVQSETQKILKDTRNGKEEHRRWWKQEQSGGPLPRNFSWKMSKEMVNSQLGRWLHSASITIGPESGNPSPQANRVRALRVHEMGNCQQWRAIWDSVAEQNFQGRRQHWKVYMGIQRRKLVDGRADTKELVEGGQAAVRVCKGSCGATPDNPEQDIVGNG